MIQRKSQFVNTQQPPDLASTRPWLDDMIGRANEVLNALLRLRKHQIASECTSEHQRVSLAVHFNAKF
jgi:vacuolar-type H+-ATPase subunit D/Vma8